MIEVELPQERSAKAKLAELYRRHAPAAIRLAYLLTADQALAEDLAQEAFVRLAGRFVEIRNPEAFEHYLRRTVVNLTNSHFRKLKVERAYLQREGARVRVHTGPQSNVEIRAEIWEALQRLPARQRLAVVLRYYEDLSERQMADVMGCPVGTVKSLVSRGMEGLRELIRGEES